MHIPPEIRMESELLTPPSSISYNAKPRGNCMAFAHYLSTCNFRDFKFDCEENPYNFEKYFLNIWRCSIKVDRWFITDVKKIKSNTIVMWCYLRHVTMRLHDALIEILSTTNSPCLATVIGTAEFSLICSLKDLMELLDLALYPSYIWKKRL